MKIALACIFAVLILFTVPVIVANATQENTIPSWIKQTMDVWVQGISTDREFLSASQVWSPLFRAAVAVSSSDTISSANAVWVFVQAP